MAAFSGEVGATVSLAQAAQRDRSAAAEERANAALFEARGHAMAGDAAAADRKLGEAEDLVAALAARTQEGRPWLYWMTPTYLENQAGITCAHLAGDPRWHSRAVALLEAPDDAAGAWAPAQNLTYLAVAHGQAGEVDHACAAALEALEAVQRSGSVRLAAVLTGVHADLHARYPDDVRVAELADALAQR